ncbi:MAG: ribosomal protein S18-alanine N-acetyltransferase [Thermoplasmata archaeon]|nr:ribosomal protein S18-alanine N-acetyltransferase [Thermoplasmata archaeon]
MIIREFEYEDLQQVMEIVYSSFEEYYTSDFFLTIWQASPDGFIVADDGEKIVGFVMGVMVDVETLRILMICVREGYRNKGIGSELLKHIIKKSGNVRKVRLEVKMSNKEAIKFYKKSGFVIKETLPDFYPDGTDAYLMEKSLF